VELPFRIPAHLVHYAGNKTCSVDLCYRKGQFTLHIVVDLPAPQTSPTDEVIEVDLGMNRPAVTSTRQFLGERRWKEQERRTFRLKRQLQAKGTRAPRDTSRSFLANSFGDAKTMATCSPNASSRMLPKALASFWKISRTFVRRARWDAANTTVRNGTASDACTVGRSRNCTRLSSTKQRHGVSVWSRWTPGIPRKRVPNVSINIAPIVGLKVCSSVVSVATRSTPI
jgi:hypothetical protein